MKMTIEYYDELVRAAYARCSTQEQMNKASAVFRELIEAALNKHPDMLKTFMHKLENIAYSVDEKEAKEYVSRLHGKDGNNGEYFSMEKSISLAEQYNVPEEIDDVSFYLALNIVRAKFFSPIRTTEDYCTLAVDFISGDTAMLSRYIKI